MARAICAECFGPLEPFYRPARSLPDRATIGARAPTMWRYREWLPFDGEPRYSLDTGFTPLIEAPRLARLLGVGALWIKNDTVSHPTLSFKDRVVAAAINAAAGLGCGTVACASTGNLAIATAAHAARAGLPAWVLIPEDLEPTKVLAAWVHGARVLRVRGNYDQVNRLATELAERFGWGIVNVNLRPYYGEGSKTVAFEIVEQLGWRLPTAIVAPMAGGSLLSKIRKGVAEFADAGLVAGSTPRLFGAQAAGCAPIVAAVETAASRITPVRPDTIARSLAIGAPADGALAVRAIRETNGWAAAVSDRALIEGIFLAAEYAGVFAETAGGVTVAATRELVRQGRLGPDDEVVLCLTAHGLKTPDVIGIDLGSLPVVPARVAEAVAVIENT